MQGNYRPRRSQPGGALQVLAHAAHAHAPPPCLLPPLSPPPKQNVHTEMVSSIVEALFCGDEEAVRTIFSTGARSQRTQCAQGLPAVRTL